MTARATTIVAGPARRVEPARPACCRPIAPRACASRAPVLRRAARTVSRTGASLTLIAAKPALRAAARAAMTAISTRIVTVFAAKPERVRQPRVATGSATEQSRTWTAEVLAVSPVRSDRAAAPTRIAAPESAQRRVVRPNLAATSNSIRERPTSTAEAAPVARAVGAPRARCLPTARAAAAPADFATLPAAVTG
jgi:hypothetical protein